MTIWSFAHLPGFVQKKQMHSFIKNSRQSWFPIFPAYQTIVNLLNLLEPSFHTGRQIATGSVTLSPTPEVDRVVDLLPVMLAQQGHYYSATSPMPDIELPSACALRVFDSIFIATRDSGQLPKPVCIRLREASTHDSKAFENQHQTALFPDLDYPSRQNITLLKEQNTKLIARQKKPKGKELLSATEKHFNRLTAKFRQPVKSLFNRLIEETEYLKG